MAWSGDGDGPLWRLGAGAPTKIWRQNFASGIAAAGAGRENGAKGEGAMDQEEQSGWLRRAASRAWAWVRRQPAKPEPVQAPPVALGGRFLGEEGLSAMGEMAQGQARKLKARQAEKAAREAFEGGRWVAATDASIAGGRASIAWGIFNPKGELAAHGAQALEGSGWNSIAVAEFEAILRAARELDELGAGGALCLSDSLYSVRGAHLGGSKQARWESVSRGRFDLGWVPREALGPANDAARAALGLRPEKGSDRPWSGWLESLSRGGAAQPASNSCWEALSQQARQAVEQALRARQWIALADARVEGNVAKMGVALFDPQGELKGMFAQSKKLSLKNDQATASRWAVEMAAKKLASRGPALCLSAALDPSMAALGNVALAKGSPAGLGSVQALAARARNTGPSQIADKKLAGQFRRWMWEMEQGSGVKPSETTSQREARLMLARQEKLAQAALDADVAAPGATPAGPARQEEQPPHAEQGKWVAVWARHGAGARVGLAAALFDDKGQFKQELCYPARIKAGQSEVEAARAWLDARLLDWGVRSWEEIEARADGSGVEREAGAALGALARSQVEPVAREPSWGQAGWQAWMERASSPVEPAPAQEPARDMPQRLKSRRPKADWLARWEREAQAQASLPPIVLDLGKRQKEHHEAHPKPQGDPRP